MRCGHLFNGIGGFQLAADWMGYENVFHVEINQFCNKIASKHFPQSIQHEDIRTTDFTIYGGGDINLLTGGDPCQPSSVIGKQKGKEDERYLWPEYFRAVREIRPGWVVNENVAGTIYNGILDQKIDDLESIGYACWAPLVIPASAAGAIHKRERAWLVAYLPERRLEGRQHGGPKRHGQTTDGSIQALVENSDWYSYARSFLHGKHDGIPARMDRIAALGNAIVPQVAYKIYQMIEQWTPAK
jgi:DNA (cytosine-5)-methyltransferase 1